MILQRPTEQATFWRAGLLDGLEMLHATFIKHQFAHHYHETYAIGMIERGVYTFYHRGEMRLIRAGEIVIINPGEIHSGQAVDALGWTYRMFYPGIVFMRQITNEITGLDSGHPYFPHAVVRDAETATLIRDAHRLIHQDADQLAQTAVLRLALGALIERHAVITHGPIFTERDERALVRRAREYLTVHYDRNVTLEELASACSISPYHLAKVFKAGTGLPPHTYLANLRVMKARQLLRAGVPIVDVAHTTGFTDQSHLSRWFKRVVGVPPGQFSA